MFKSFEFHWDFIIHILMATLHELLVEAVMNMSKVKRLRSLVYAQGASNLQKEHVAVDVFFIYFLFFRKGQPSI